jgi:hypothetical protein
VRCDGWAKAFPHSKHSQGFSPVWILKWRIRSPLSLKAFLHSLQSKGFFSSVGSFMQNESGVVIKDLFTFSTLIRFLSTVNPLVLLEA